MRCHPSYEHISHPCITANVTRANVSIRFVPALGIRWLLLPVVAPSVHWNYVSWQTSRVWCLFAQNGSRVSSKIEAYRIYIGTIFCVHSVSGTEKTRGKGLRAHYTRAMQISCIDIRHECRWDGLPKRKLTVHICGVCRVCSNGNKIHEQTFSDIIGISEAIEVAEVDSSAHIM